jgi:S-adenosylmethionine:tRNA-ribosyltransferase-isomerase (queuine synthetase)
MALSRLLRRYLAEKFGIPALEMTTSELVEALNQQEIEEDQIEKFRALLENADVVKFSGQSAEPARLTEWYSVVEAWLERELQKHAAETRAEESRKKKKFLRK